MSNQSRIVFTILALTLIVSACNLPVSIPLTVATQAQSPTSPLPPTAPVAVISTLPVADTVPPGPLPTTLQVIITASTGDLNIRRGPGVGYNAVGVLYKDEFSVATARNDRGDWLYIAIPEQAEKSGWVNTLTQYSIVSGDVMALSVLAIDPPKLAYFRNCTFRPMLVDPGGIVIPGQGQAPLNTVQVSPGQYVIKDGMTEGTPMVMEATLLEGYTIDIRTDAIPKTYSCP